MGLRTSRRIRTGIAVWLILLSAADFTIAAEHRGEVAFNGLGVPGAVITVLRDGKEHSTATDALGRYAFSDLSEGMWKIRVEMQTFAPAEQDVIIAPGAAAMKWELKLLPIDQIPGLQKAAPSPPASTIEATPSEAPARKDEQSAKARLSATTNTQAPFRPTEVNATATAVQYEESSDPSSEGTPATSPRGVFSGLDQDELNRQAADGFLISGSSRNSGASSFGLSRSFGNARGIVRSLYGGSAGFTVDNSALNARPYSLAGIDTRKSAYNRMQGVFSFNAPLRIPGIVRHGPRFYVGYQFTRNRNAETGSGLVPTLAERNGDLSGTQGPIIDPVTTQPFADNRIPEDRISPQAKSLLNLIPLPNFTGNAGYNYQVPLVNSTSSDLTFIRANRQIGRRNQLSGTFSLQSARSDTPTIFGFPSANRSLGSSLLVSLQRDFTQRLSSTFGFRFNRQSSRTSSFFGNRENVSGNAGIAGNNQEAVNWGPPTLAFFSGLTSLSDATPSSNSTQTFGFVHSGWWNRGDHTVTFGGEYRRHQVNLLSQQNPRGAFTFTGASTLGPSAGASRAGARNDFAGFLLGIPDTVSIAFGNADKYFRSSAYNAHLADDWRVNRRFTLNLGVRWEYSSPVTERYGRLVNLDIADGFSAVAPVLALHPVGRLSGVRYPESLLHPRRSAFQPRIGFAWKPILASSLVMRGGYGIYYNSSPYQSIASEMAQQSPLSKSLSLQNTVDRPLTLANGFNASGTAAAGSFAVDPDLKIGYVHIWQMSLQLDLPVSLQVLTTYRGTLGGNALQEMLPNTYPAGAVNSCPDCPRGFRYLTSHGTSERHAGTIQLRRRLRSGLAASSEYTFSKSIDDAAPGAGSSGAVFIAQNWLNLRGERALSSFDQRHTASFRFEYTTGMGVSGGMLMRGWRGALYKEWTVSSMISIGSGTPQTPLFPSAIVGTGVTGALRPDATSADIYAAPPGMHLNPAAYRAPEAGRWGNAGRNSIVGPSQFSLDATLARTFRTSDRTALNLSIDAANALNHATFTSWNATVGSAQFGLPVASRPMRSVRTSIRWSF